MSESLTTYAELADTIERLPDLLRDARRARGLSLRAAGEQVGISYSNLTRIEIGDAGFTVANAVAVLRWLDQTGPTS